MGDIFILALRGHYHFGATFILKINCKKNSEEIDLSYESLLQCDEIIIPSNCAHCIDEDLIAQKNVSITKLPESEINNLCCEIC